MTYFKAKFRYLKRLRKIKETRVWTAGVPAEIRATDLPHSKQEV